MDNCLELNFPHSALYCLLSNACALHLLGRPSLYSLLTQSPTYTSPTYCPKATQSVGLGRIIQSGGCSYVLKDTTGKVTKPMVSGRHPALREVNEKDPCEGCRV